MPQGHKGRGRLRNSWKRDLESEMWTAGFRFSWRKMEMAAQDSGVEMSGLWPMLYWE